MGVGVLGPVEVNGAAPLEPRDRMALGVLVVRHGETVTPDQFADALWADRPPSSWSKQVQICVGRLRKVLGPDAIVTTAGGYRLSLDDDELDVCRFERLVERARELTAVGEHDRAAATYRRALALWRGPPLDELDGWSPGQSEVARLQELRRGSRRSGSLPASTRASSARSPRSPKAWSTRNRCGSGGGRSWRSPSTAVPARSTRSDRSPVPAGCSANWASTREANSSNWKGRSSVRTRPLR